MTAYALALASALLYGAGDFCGGFASRRVSALAVVAVSQAAGLLLLALVLPFLAGTPTRADLAWGAVAGCGGGLGVGLLYRALAIGAMGVVAPTTAVCAVGLPVLVAVTLGERPSTLALAGIALALVAIVLVSRSPAGDTSPEGAIGTSVLRRHFPPGFGLALLSGVAIGVFFLALARTHAAAGLWPLLAARGTSASLFLALVWFGGRPARMDAVTWTIVLLAGALDMAANVFYLLATRGAPLTGVVTLASLYPASTVLLARLVLGERLGRWQAVGVICALMAVALIVA